MRGRHSAVTQPLGPPPPSVTSRNRLPFGGEGILGWTVAMRRNDVRIEESPGSLDKLPGNAWAPFVVTESATEKKPPV